MIDDADDASPPTPSLDAALRRARLEAAEQGAAISGVHQADVARLSLLEDALRPVVDQAPPAANMFDLGKTYGDPPRLFLDMIAFVELAQDRRSYRFFQDTRYGRILIAESADVRVIVAAATNYVARRLVERERALASDWRSAASDAPKPKQGLPRPTVRRPSRPRGGALRLIGDVMNAFFIGLGTLVLIALIFAGVYWAWTQYLAQHFGTAGL